MRLKFVDKRFLKIRVCHSSQSFWGRFLSDFAGRFSVKRDPFRPCSGLQNRLRGGGGNKAKDAKKKENALLTQLTKVLEQFAGPGGQQQVSSGDTDGLLFGALSRLVERASKNPSGLLDRLQELVRATKNGQLRAPGPKRKHRSKTASKDGSKKEPTAASWAQVVGIKGENKGQPPKQKPDSNGGKRDALRLEPTCWHGRLVAWHTVVEAIRLSKKVFFRLVRSAWLLLKKKRKKCFGFAKHMV